MVDMIWIQDITGTLTIQAISEYLLLWEAVEGVQLRQGVEDTISWKWTSDATYLARSTYQAFFHGSTQFKGARLIWNAWAPVKVKIFTWLAVKGHIWTVDCSHRRGITTGIDCRLCDQEVETTQWNS